MATEKSNGLIRDFDFHYPSVRIVYSIVVIISFIAAITGIFPLAWMLLSGFKELAEFVNETTIFPRAFDFGNYVKTWNETHFLLYFRNSMISVTGSIASAVLFNGLMGYTISKIKPAGSNIVFAMILWSLLIPATTSIVPLFVNIVRLGLTGSFVPLWLNIGANAFFVVLFKSFFDELPKSLIEAAKLDGASDLRVFFSIAVPLSKAIIAVIVIYAINAAWSDFLLPFLVLPNGMETVMVRLYQYSGAGSVNDIDKIRAIVFAFIPPVVLFLIFQRYITGISIQSGVKG